MYYRRTERSSAGKVSCGGTCPLGLSPRVSMSACIFLNSLPDLTGAILLVAGNVPVDKAVCGVYVSVCVSQKKYTLLRNNIFKYSAPAAIQNTID